MLFERLAGRMNTMTGMTKRMTVELVTAAAVLRKAKNLLRASRLPLLPADDPDVARDLKKIRKGRGLCMW